jgi:hypothetical protein
VGERTPFVVDYDQVQVAVDGQLGRDQTHRIGQRQRDFV